MVKTEAVRRTRDRNALKSHAIQKIEIDKKNMLYK